jgi:aryl-alcohol dehydrogenase-like predicted oxidoreductase/predicted kinase/histidinol phosphatase-like enzyme
MARSYVDLSHAEFRMQHADGATVDLMNPIAMGCMRLSTERETPDGPRDEARAVEVLHAAFDGGVTLLDTADAYCLDDSEVGHNERLIAHALRTWSGDRRRIFVASKGGLTRPGGEWVPDGRGRHLRVACEASLRALGLERIHLYQLHAVDPRTPLATSVRALAALKDDGLIERVGLCNVNVGQIEEARRIAEIAAVQVELSPWYDTNLLNGVVQYCITHRIQLLAYRPLGGRRKRRRMLFNRALLEVSARHRATAAAIALAWLADLSDAIVTLPGPTRLETVRSLIQASHIQLTDEDRSHLDSALPAGQAARNAARATEGPPLRGGESSLIDGPEGAALPGTTRSGGSSALRDGEVVLVMGLPAAGKSTIARALVEQGYTRLNRDETGGTLRDLLPRLEQVVAEGSSRIVLDNTYVSRASRALVIQAAGRLGLPVRCLWLSTSVEDAQVNATWRMVSKHGRLLDPDEMRKTVQRDISAFAPGVQFRHQRELEPPDPAEGFSQIETVAFQRTRDVSMTNRALIVWCDDVLLRSKSGGRSPSSAEDVHVLVERAAILRRYRDEGWRLLGLAWRPEIADQTLTIDQVQAGFARMQELLGVSMEILYCPHGAGPPICWCRKPLPGQAVVFIHRHRLDPPQCIYVGAGSQDPGFARRLGFQYCDVRGFFGGPL